MHDARRWAPRRPARQLCLICSIVEGLAAQAEQDLAAGQVEAVREALRRVRAQISGVRQPPAPCCAAPSRPVGWR